MPVWGGSPSAQGDFVSIPEAVTTGNSTRVAQVLFDGASFITPIIGATNRLLARVTARTGAPTGRFLLYQALATEGVPPVELVAHAENVVIPAANTNFEIPFVEGIATLQAGPYYLLFGRDSVLGSFTMRTRAVQALDLYTANTDPSMHAVCFTTTIPANTTPATFDPRPSLTVLPAMLDLVLVHRFKLV